ncbi:MAG TPA: tetratricopeptide repeat protein, partial [Sandaracinaceae bacterium]
SGAPTNARAGAPFAPIDRGPDELGGEPTRAHVPLEDDPATHLRAPRVVGGMAGPPPSYPPAGHASPYAAASAPSAPPFAPAPEPRARDAEPSARGESFVPPPPSSPARGPAALPTVRTPRNRPRWLVPAAAGAAGVLALGILLAIAISAWLDARSAEAIREAAGAAGDSGMRSDFEAVVAAIEAEETDDPELIALRARLLATLALEHDQDRAAQVDALLARLGAEPTTDGRIAAALRDLDDGRAGPALQRLSGLTAQGEQIAEAFRARALATAALGRYDQAEASAAQAASLRQGAPRHAALHALMRHRVGDTAGALALLDAVPQGARFPAVRLARARIQLESGRDWASAREEANAVLGELAERASPHELAWAHLVRARLAIEEGDASQALTEARAAAEHPPPADEPFGMLLAETFLRAGAAQRASEQLERLPPPVDAPARAMLAAEVALAVGDLDAADAALQGAADGPRKSLLRGQVLEARGRPDEARPLYEQAMQAPGPEGRRARVRLAAIAMNRGDAQRAIELLEPARAGAADDLELVPLLARAYLARDRVDDAEQIVDVALSRRQGAAELLAARGAVQLRRGWFTEALASLRSAASARPEDPDLQADLGEAAGRAGQADAARQAFEAALALRPQHVRALVGLARLAMRRGDFAQAEQHIETAARTGQGGLEVARARGELAVQRGDGALGVAVLEPLARQYDDAEVWIALGYLYAQAELDRDAGRAFARALRRDRDSPEALLGESLVAVRRGDLGGARRSIATAAEQGRARGLGSDFLARLAVARARLEFENGDFRAAAELANEALRHDERNASAHLLLANIAIERAESPVEHLRRAVQGDAPPPEALGRLAARLSRGEEACRLARRYLEVAPRGYDAPDVREVASHCP